MYFRTIMNEDGFFITNTWKINFKFNSVQCLIHKLWNSVERSCLDYNTNVCTITVIGRNSIILFAYWKYSFMAIFLKRFKLIINVAYNTLLFFNGILGLLNRKILFQIQNRNDTIDHLTRVETFEHVVFICRNKQYILILFVFILNKHLQLALLLICLSFLPFKICVKQ